MTSVLDDAGDKLEGATDNTGAEDLLEDDDKSEAAEEDARDTLEDSGDESEGEETGHELDSVASDSRVQTSWLLTSRMSTS